MYLYRLVIDANCVNAKNLLPAMTELEKYHSVGALEMLVTSTLAAELDRTSSQAMKARRYQTIGGITLFFQGSHVAQSMPGACVRKSLLHELHQNLFGYDLSGHTRTRALRDCLHLDQARMNAADVFITNDKRLYKAPQILQQHHVRLAVASPDEALEHVRSHLVRAIGSSDIQAAEAYCRDMGPLILGSNSGGPCVVTSSTGERVVEFQIVDGLLQVHARLRNSHGNCMLETYPGNAPEFHGPGISINGAGRGPILVVEQPMSSVVIADNDEVYLALRTTHTGKVVIYDMSIRDDKGVVIAAVRGETLQLCGASFGF